MSQEHVSFSRREKTGNRCYLTAAEPSGCIWKHPEVNVENRNSGLRVPWDMPKGAAEQGEARPGGKVPALGLLRGPGPCGPHHGGSGHNAERICRTELQSEIKRIGVPKIKSKL